MVELPSTPEGGLQVRVEGERVDHSWFVGVVGHRYYWLGGAGMEVVVGRHAYKARGMGHISGDAAGTSRV